MRENEAVPTSKVNPVSPPGQSRSPCLPKTACLSSAWAARFGGLLSPVSFVVLHESTDVHPPSSVLRRTVFTMGFHHAKER